MPFQVSPGVNVSEIDLTTIVPAVSTTEGAIAGAFRWGPIDKVVLTDNEDRLWSRFGKPSNFNYETFFTAANFLSYGNRLYVSRAANTVGLSATVGDGTATTHDGAIFTSPTTFSTNGSLVISPSSANIQNFSYRRLSVFSQVISDVITPASGTFSTDIKPGMRVVGTGVSNSTVTQYVVAANSTEIQLTSNAVATLTDEITVTGYINNGAAATYKVISADFPENTTVLSVSNLNLTLSKQSLVSANSSTPFVVIEPDAVFSAIANSGQVTTSFSTYTIKNEDDFITKTFTETDIHAVARYPGELGNSLKISVCDSPTQYNTTINIAADGTFTNSAGGSVSANSTNINTTATAITFTVGSNTATVAVKLLSPAQDNDAPEYLQSILNKIVLGDYLVAGNNLTGKQYLKVTNIGSITNSSSENAQSIISLEDKLSLSTNYSSSSVERWWEYYATVDATATSGWQSEYVNNFGNTSANDILHVVITDQDGKITNVPGTILEVYKGLSRATDSKSPDGAALYYKTVLNENSNYIWWINDRTSVPSATAALVQSSTQTKPLSLSFIGGSDGADESNVSIADLAKAYDKFKSAEDIDISLILQGKARGASNGAQLANYIIDNICEQRKDCVAFISPEKADVVANANKDEVDDVIQFRNSISSTSYAVLDSGYKYQYDKYNDVYRWVPLNGDIAGLAVRTDSVRDPWWSPAGFNRGQIKNIIKLAYNPGKAERDSLYKAGVNPVVTFPGQGTILFGDKTLLAKPSAFDRINVRRLFIVLEKAIATAAKFTLFEFNDEFTRAQFRNLVEPFLRDVQGRRGIYDFRVVCDESNNTGEVIDRNEFIGDIYIKPARSINFIQLNFVAVRTGVEFSEVVGKF